MRVLPHLLFVALLWLVLGWQANARAEELPVFDVVARDGRLSPPRLEVPAGSRIKLVVRNEGRAPVEFENLAMRVEKVLAPGATSFVVLPRLQPGEYEFIDEFHMETGRMLVIAK
jgi:hypothetical protein